MIIRYIYIYYYVTVWSPPRYRRLPPPMSLGLDDFLEKLGIKTADPIKKAKLKELGKALSHLQHTANQIPSAGIRQMLMSRVQDVMRLAGEGLLDEALALATQSAGLADTCLDLCKHIGGNCTTLKNAIGVRGPAKNVLREIARVAQSAMNGAGSLKDLQDISSYTDAAVEISKQLRGLDPSSREYAKLMNDLCTILDNLGEFNQEDEEGDSLKASLGMGSMVRKHLAQLRDGVTDPVKLAKLEQLELILGSALEHAEDVQNKEWMRAQIAHILALAAEGKHDQALAAGQKFQSECLQFAGLNRHLDKKMERLAAIAAKLKGPAHEALIKGIEAARMLREHATSPEELHELDQMLMELLEGADSHAAQGAGAPLRGPAYLKMLAASRKLQAKKPKNDKVTKRFGQDSYRTYPPSGGSPGAVPGNAARPGGRTAPTGLLPGAGRVGTRPLSANDAMKDAIADAETEVQVISRTQQIAREVGKLALLGNRCSARGKAAVASAAGRAAANLAVADDNLDFGVVGALLEEAKNQARMLGDASPGSSEEDRLVAVMEGLFPPVKPPAGEPSPGAYEPSPGAPAAK